MKKMILTLLLAGALLLSACGAAARPAEAAADGETAAGSASAAGAAAAATAATTAAAAKKDEEKWVAVTVNRTGQAIYSKTEYAYDVHGEKIRETNYNDNGSATDEYTREYDSHGSCVYCLHSQYFNGDKSDVDHSVVTYEFQYDDAGNITAEQRWDDGKFKEYKKYEYDSQGRVVKESTCNDQGDPNYWVVKDYTDWGAVKSSTGYDKNGMLTQGTYTHTFEYNEHHNRIRETFSDGSCETTEYEYDADGHVLKQTWTSDKNSFKNVLEKTYDESGRVVSYLNNNVSKATGEAVFQEHWTKQYYADGHSYLQTDFDWSGEVFQTEEYLLQPLSEAAQQETAQETAQETTAGAKIDYAAYNGYWSTDDKMTGVQVSNASADSVTFLIKFYGLYTFSSMTVKPTAGTAAFRDSGTGISGKLTFGDRTLTLSLNKDDASSSMIQTLQSSEFTCRPLSEETKSAGGSAAYSDYVGTWKLTSGTGDLLISSVSADSITFSMGFYRITNFNNLSAKPSADGKAAFTDPDSGVSGTLTFGSGMITLSFQKNDASSYLIKTLGASEFTYRAG